MTTIGWLFTERQESLVHPRCAGCGALLSWRLLRSHVGESVFCGDCRETGRPFDAADPYDDIGGSG